MEYGERGLAALSFPRAGEVPTPSAETGVVEVEIRRWHALTIKAVKSVLAGRLPAQLPPLDLTGGTPFQQSVWRALQAIPLGQTKELRGSRRGPGPPPGGSRGRDGLRGQSHSAADSLSPRARHRRRFGRFHGRAGVETPLAEGGSGGGKMLKLEG